MDLELSGKRALVTGSSSGIGAGIARTLAREGAYVIVHGRSPDRTIAVHEDIAREGGTSAAVTGDLQSDFGATKVYEAATACFNGIDILINNAGGAVGPSGPRDWVDVKPDE